MSLMRSLDMKDGRAPVVALSCCIAMGDGMLPIPSDDGRSAGPFMLLSLHGEELGFCTFPQSWGDLSGSLLANGAACITVPLAQFGMVGPVGATNLVLLPNAERWRLHKLIAVHLMGIYPEQLAEIPGCSFHPINSTAS
ncbi:hypothetical protein EOD42_22535 [Rhodovarius crocodyli]|uniref:Uncharacterized protein n=1 Tax=Rhodovarius crocodyli TaxID=1979269 RepID=A0A437M1I0_9PROT|nr:hypothetical protein [Rhodovarius crocodyli]RVT91436.1 hypothetical protein EOD42_22535 [Rhodovarius crocodyli]